MSEKKPEFQINEYLSLRLEDDRTNIYVAGKLFRQCKFLLLNIPIDKLSTLDELESIDEAAEKLDHSLEPRRDVKESMYKIPPEVEFWGHCSNLQVWYEYEYNTKLLHSNLAFHLLGKLAKVGDPQAKKVFKEEIADRYNNGVESVRKYLRSMGFLQYLTTENFLNLIDNEQEINSIDKLREQIPQIEKFEDLGIDIKKGKVISLKLRGLNLKKVPEFVQKFRSLKRIDLSYNSLELLPGWIVDLKELKDLQINDNFLKELPINIGKMESLEKIQARNNKLKNLPESIGQLQSLKTLELYENKIESLPKEIGTLSNLEILSLYENNLTNIPDSIGDLSSLKKLSLDKNRLNELPESFGKLIKLKSLVLDSNYINFLPESFKNLTELELLSLSNNPLNNIPKSILMLPKLKDLWVRKTPLKGFQIIKEKFKSNLVDIHFK